MKKTEEETTEKKQNLSILIVNKASALGVKLARFLKEESIVVFVGDREDELGREDFRNLIFVPFGNKIPQIPDITYSSMVVIYDGEKEILHLLPEFIKKAQRDKTELLFVVKLAYSTEALISRLITSYENLRVVMVGDLFDADIPLDTSLIINKFFHQAIEKGRLEVPGEGMEKTYPVLLNDAVENIKELVLGKQKKSRNFALFLKYPPTELSLAHIMHKINPLLKIDFTGNVSREKKDNYYIPPEIEYLLDKEYSLEKKIRKLHILEEAFLQNKESLKNRKDLIFLDSNKISGNSFGKTFFFAAFLFLIVITLPVVIVFSSLSAGVKMLEKAKAAVEKGDVVSAQKFARYSGNAFSVAQLSSLVLVPQLSAIGKEEVASSVMEFANMGKETSAVFLSVSEAIQKLSGVFNGKSKNPKEDFMASVNLIKPSLVFIQRIKGENQSFFQKQSLGSNSIESYLEQLVIKKDQYNNFISKISNLSTLTNLFVSTIDAAPKIFGFEGDKSYLVLFQNNMELRPGGGFIGSFGLLKISSGKISKFDIHDVYDADGQLKGHIEPPFAVRRYLPSVHWYLRDSNFDIDFAKGASASAFFLNQEMNETADGVIAVDVTFVKNLLTSTGPVFVADYNETVTSDNLYLLTQTHSEKNFFPGSSQKKDFLRSLFNSMQLNLSSNKKIEYFSLIEELEKSIMEKHLLFAFANPSLQSLFSVNNASSSLRDDRRGDNATINDFLGIVEANVGGNKANYFMRRKKNQDVRIAKDGSVVANLTIEYQNNSSEWPGGEYKNYMRLILPLGSKLSLIIIDGKEQKIRDAIIDPRVYEGRNFKPYAELEVEKTQQEKKSVFGFFMTVPEKSSKTISITYILPNKVLMDQPSFVYSSKLFKQPGIEDDQFSFSLSFPDEYRPIKTPDNFNMNENRISFISSLSRDLDFNIRFSKK